MAKKSKAKKKKAPVGRERKPAKIAKQHRRQAPRSQVLPGMEQVRSTPLDRICEGIGDCRTSMNAARTEEGGLTVSALQVMQKRGISVYRHAGIELARVPGAEKLRVRATKEEGDADISDLETPESGGDEAQQEDDREPEGEADLAEGVH